MVRIILQSYTRHMIQRFNFKTGITEATPTSILKSFSRSSWILLKQGTVKPVYSGHAI